MSWLHGLQIWSHDSRSGVTTSDLKSWLQIWSHDCHPGVMTPDLESWLQIWGHDLRSEVMTPDLESWMSSGVMTPDLESWLQIWGHDFRSGVMNVIWSHDSRSGVMTSDLRFTQGAPDFFYKFCMGFWGFQTMAPFSFDSQFDFLSIGIGAMFWNCFRWMKTCFLSQHYERAN